MSASPSTAGAAWAEAPASGLGFPYMVWARTRSGDARFSMTQSGMPPADPALLGPAPEVELGHAGPVLSEVEAAIARRFGVPADRVVATIGASGGLQACAWAWFRPGTRVVADAPSYEPFRALPQRLGADLRVLERRLEDGWQIDPADVRRRLGAGPGRGHVFLANVHNPTGAQLGKERLAAIAREAERAGGILVSCDIYAEYEPDAARVDAFRCAPNAVSIGSLTKAYGLGSLRIGWVVLGEGVAADVHALRDATYLGWVDAPIASLRLGLRALDRLPRLLEPYHELVRTTRPAWSRWLTQTEGVRALVPDHGIIAFPRIEGAADTFALADFLLREHEVGVVPGEFFGMAGHVRVGMGLPAREMEEALDRLTRGIAAWRARRA
ncbi:MAG: pyridoxal phosphate-dependent aminotransferase [Planctomycetota bacterium]|nr:pyridoxal phosphate-dependent aminotransferase [Planctomycetota bacterium]